MRKVWEGRASPVRYEGVWVENGPSHLGRSGPYLKEKEEEGEKCSAGERRLLRVYLSRHRAGRPPREGTQPCRAAGVRRRRA